MRYNDYFKEGELIKLKQETPAIDFEWGARWTSGPCRIKLYAEHIYIVLRLTQYKVEVLNQKITQTGVEVMDINNFKKKTIPVDKDVPLEVLNSYFERLTGDDKS